MPVASCSVDHPKMFSYVAKSPLGYKTCPWATDLQDWYREICGVLKAIMFPLTQEVLLVSRGVRAAYQEIRIQAHCWTRNLRSYLFQPLCWSGSGVDDRQRRNWPHGDHHNMEYTMVRWRIGNRVVSLGETCKHYI